MPDPGKTTTQLAEELELARAQLTEARAIADNSSDFIMRYDRAARHTYANPAARAAAGPLGEGCLGKTHAELGFPDHVCELMKTKIAQVFDDRARVSIELTVELDGKPTCLELKLHPERDPDGAVISVLGVARDITERKRTEEALRQRTAEMEALFRAYPDLSFRLGSDGTILAFHAGRASDLFTTPDQFLGKRMQDVLPPSVGRQFDEILVRVLDGDMASMEYALPFPTGERCFEARAMPILDGQIYVVVRDISKRKEAEENRRQLEARIQRAQKLESLGILAGGIAHDFNNILTGLLGSADLALADLPPTSSIRPLLHNIQNAARQAAGLTGQMLAYSGKGKFVLEDVDVSALVKDMSSLLESSTSKKAELILELPPELPKVRADATQLRQIVLNLVVNASDAVGEQEGRVRVRTYAAEWERGLQSEPGSSPAKGWHVAVEVTDTGCGMDEETQAKMFDPFFTTKFAGRGLGLAAVQGIVRGHQGAIFVESEPGKGTTIKVQLPTVDEPTAPESSPPVSVTDWQGTGTVLVVDDEEAVRSVVTQMLERYGFTVLTASDGVEAVELFRARGDEVDCVLLDLKMPRMDGEETFEALRKIRESAVVILTSGYGEQASTERFGDKGLAGFIQKPFTLACLMETVRAAMKGAKAGG